MKTIVPSSRQVAQTGGVETVEAPKTSVFQKSKLSRREMLKFTAAGAVGVAFKSEANSQVQPPTLAPRTYAVWPYSFPSTPPTVRLVFHGLLSFCFDGKKSAEVGIHNATHTNGHKHPHSLNITVWTKTGSSCTSITIPVDDPMKHTEYKINAVGTVPELDGVYVYALKDFDRKVPDGSSSKNDKKDFQWVLDFEGADFYGNKVDKHSKKLRPSLNIDRGLFYTLHRTNSRFKRVKPDGTDPRELGYVAQYVGTDIHLSSGGYVELVVDKVPIRLDAKENIQYQVDFTNDCVKAGMPCKFYHTNSDPTERNDFYLYYDTFKVPGGKQKYELLCWDPQSNTEVPAICPEGVVYARSTDPAPCGPGVHGASGGLG
ncbi:MAG: hypothetical protein AABO41_04585 [Acidobacteriota bacterium]